MTAATRVSNKQILDALNDLPSQIAAALATVSVQAAPVAQSTTVAAPTTDTIKVDAAYKQHMLEKIQPFADKHGEDVVLYARRNVRGETKLAYAVKSKFTVLKDRGFLGAIAIVNPS